MLKRGLACLFATLVALSPSALAAPVASGSIGFDVYYGKQGPACSACTTSSTAKAASTTTACAPSCSAWISAAASSRAPASTGRPGG
jgi:hypothetical protein